MNHAINGLASIRRPAQMVKRRNRTIAHTHSVGTDSRNPTGLDVREFDMTNNGDRQALIRFLSFCASNGFKVEFIPAQ
jgi:hypothetical protein